MAEEMYTLKLTRMQVSRLSWMLEHALKLTRTDEDRAIGTDLLARLHHMLWPGYWKEQEAADAIKPGDPLG